MYTAQIDSTARILIRCVAVCRGWATRDQVDFLSDATILTSIVGGVAALVAAV